MIMADVFKILFPVIGTLMSFVCFWLVFQAIFPQAVARSNNAYAGHPIRAIFAGICFTAPAVFIGTALLGSGAPPAQFMGFTIFFLLVTVGILGSAGLSQLIGQRLSSPGDTKQPWKRVLRGGSILSITFLFPLIGWFLVLPLALVSGVGAAMLSWWSRRDQDIEIEVVPA